MPARRKIPNDPVLPRRHPQNGSDLDHPGKASYVLR
jgi:hypothetical protein